MKIYIIRHGETVANAAGRMQGLEDGPLNENGIKLAEITGKKLSGTKFDAAYSSPLSRAAQTAGIVLKESGNSCQIMFDDRLKEFDMGDYEGHNFRQENLPGVKEFLINPIPVGAFPNGEDIHHVMQRTQECLKEIAKTGYENVLVSSHGCAVRAMLNFLYDDSSDFWQGHVPYNCCINIVEVRDGSLKLIEKDKVLYDPDMCIDRFAVEDVK